MIAKSVSLTSGIAMPQACLARVDVVRSTNVREAERADAVNGPMEICRETCSGGYILSPGRMRSAAGFRAYCSRQDGAWPGPRRLGSPAKPGSATITGNWQRRRRSRFQGGGSETQDG